jgi:hypothetical protein
MRNLDISDSRDKLNVYAKAGMLAAGSGAANLLDDKSAAKP